MRLFVASCGVGAVRRRPLLAIAVGAAALSVGVVCWMLPRGVAQDQPPAANSVPGAGASLSDDGRIGKVKSAQGVVTLRPLAQRRWTPVSGPTALRPGDWLRTDLRGAHATEFQLADGVAITLGPGSLVELPRAGVVHVHSGTLQVRAAEGAPVEVIEPDGQSRRIDDEQILRVAGGTLDRIADKPLWLQGFEGTTANESLGSLVATIDGRETPLTVGYHKVTVDIRDQIARTTIEESFVNHTLGRLEGVFYFPLPEDASISGFGMWINNELVEADIVEKQRAREIYETILRERRDPGLLEWNGGNIFKARVFPIEAGSEKRIKISYTQVLPMRGGAYTYSYALHSEMLRKTPLRDLSLDVTIHSALPLASVTSPTHPVRVQKTSQSARVEFAAQEYAPTRDFEVTVAVDGGRPEVVMIPHRRGDDGYFLLMVTPPDASGQWRRELVADGEPLDLLVLADTSASIDAAQRKTQAELVAAVLSSLSPDDRFNLAGCDVDCNWVFDQSRTATPQAINEARQFLDARTSLGWTNLDKSIAEALEKAGPRTQVIYLGDGVVSTGKAEPAEAALRLRNLHAQSDAKPTFHAVALGSTYDSTVLKAIASLGGGSMRRVEASRGSAATVLELLSEITRPGVKDLQVEFRGLRTARVYPGALPNLSDGTQQILLGRYMPDGEAPTGEVVVTGRQGERDVRFTAGVTLADAEQGNSFIPRLWARMHLDELLAQGSSPTIVDEIIALSEEYNIMTPYTSLLVLETDADRERFKVKRRVQMRDGEKFFAEGRSAAATQILQQAMREAGDWRLGLREQVLADFARLGRVPPGSRTNLSLVISSSGARYDQDVRGYWESNKDAIPFGDTQTPALKRHLLLADETYSLDKMQVAGDPPVDYLGYDMNGRSNREFFDLQSEINPGWTSYPQLSSRLEASSSEIYAARRLSSRQALRPEPRARISEGYYMASDGLPSGYGYVSGPAVAEFGESVGWATGLFVNNEEVLQSYERIRGGGGDWLSRLFPTAPAPPRIVREAPTAWPEEAREILNRLLALEKNVDQGLGEGQSLRITVQREYFEPRYEELTGQSDRFALYSPGKWLTREQQRGAATTIHWLEDKTRGALSEAFLLGSVRPAVDAEREREYLELRLDRSSIPYGESYGQHEPIVARPAAGRIVLTLRHPSNPSNVLRYEIDDERNVLLSVEQLYGDEVTSRSVFSDFVEAAGAWWPRKMENFDRQGRKTANVTQTIDVIGRDAMNEQFAQRLAILEESQTLTLPTPGVLAAKQAVADGEATFTDRAALMLHFAATQQWDEVESQLAAAERLAEGKPGVRWLRNEFMLAARRRDDLRQRFLAEAADLARPEAAAGDESLFLANFIVERSRQMLETNEQIAQMRSLEAVFVAQPAYTGAMKAYRQQVAYAVGNTGRADEALALWAELAADYPRDSNVQLQYTGQLRTQVGSQAALDWIHRALSANELWNEGQVSSIRSFCADLLKSEGRFAELVQNAQDWIERTPENSDAHGELLIALVYDNQPDRSDEMAGQWIDVEFGAGPLLRSDAARISAAISFILGDYYQYDWRSLHEKWLPALSDLVRRSMVHDLHVQYANQVMQNGQFARTDACRELRGEIAARLAQSAAGSTILQLNQMIPWILQNDRPIEPETWRAIGANLRSRWEDEENVVDKYTTAELVLQVMPHYATADEQLEFQRLLLETATERYRATYASRLFYAILAQPWRIEYEDESLALLFIDHEEYEALPLDQRLAMVSLQRLYRWTDTMAQGRFQAKMEAIEHPETLTRTELAELQRENTKLARQELAARLRETASGDPTPLSPWLVVERIYLEILVDGDAARLADECWEFLPAVRASQIASGEELSESALTARIHEAMFRYRYLQMLSHLAIKDAPTAQRLLDYVDGAIAQFPHNYGWKQQKYMLLVGLDRVEPLRANLVEWSETAGADQRWRLSLGRLLAEVGDVQEAIEQFEAVRTVDELGPAEYRALADWYLVVDRLDDRHRARIRMYMSAPENDLSQYLSQQLGRLQYGVAPGRSDPFGPLSPTGGSSLSELDEEVLLVFEALFAKSPNPGRYVQQLGNYYRSTRNFRLLATLPDAVIGQTASKVYPMLQDSRYVFVGIFEEATVDEMNEAIAASRQRATSDVDRRALDLLEVAVARRGTELLNQPGDHERRALAALRRAFDREWAEGEPWLMADYLANLGSIPTPELAAEQRRQATALHAMLEAGTSDRLRAAVALARLHSVYGQLEESTDLLESALAEFSQANNGDLPQLSNYAISQYLDQLYRLKRFSRAERFLLDRLAQTTSTERVNYFTERMFQTYVEALRQDGTVSLGAGRVLFERVEERLTAQVARSSDIQQRRTLIDQLCNLYVEGNRRSFDGVAARLRAAASGPINDVLRREVNYHSHIVQAVTRCLEEVAGPRDALAFLIEQFEREPAWFVIANRDGWRNHAYLLGDLRTKVQTLGDLEPRLLAIVREELRRDLRTQQQRERSIYWANSDRFWSDKAEEFQTVAEEVWRERRNSAASVVYIADYLFNGLTLNARALEMMWIAQREGRLSDDQTAVLVDMLHRSNRFEESIPLLTRLVERTPDALQYRIQLMRAYFHTGRRDSLIAALAAADEHFHQDRRWREDVIAALAQSCLMNELFTQSVAYYDEVIPLRQRSRSDGGQGDTELSYYYANLARAHAGLGNTAQAVDAACGSIVSWGADVANRRNAVGSLEQVLREAPDLQAYVYLLDDEIETTGLDKPIVRKALGKIFLESRRFEAAIAQLEIAVALEPGDMEVHDSLIAAYDAIGNRPAAVAQLLRSIDLAPREIQRYRDLAERVTSDEPRRERALTSIVEALPLESESHAMLAEIRESQNRWDEAIDQWRRVAELRSLEPVGLLQIAEAQVQLGRWSEADATLRTLTSQRWPDRFGEIENQFATLRQRIDEGRRDER